jgi:hypothetical protein
MPDAPELNLREQIARIDRTLIENQKFAVEQQKLAARLPPLTQPWPASHWGMAVLVIGSWIVGMFIGAGLTIPVWLPVWQRLFR